MLGFFQSKQYFISEWTFMSPFFFFKTVFSDGMQLHVTKNLMMVKHISTTAAYLQADCVFPFSCSFRYIKGGYKKRKPTFSGHFEKLP